MRQKGAYKAKYQPLLWAIFYDIYKLAWPDLILELIHIIKPSRNSTIFVYNTGYHTV